MRTRIILPTYNVARQLSLVLPGLAKYKNRVLFVDDGSTDDTTALLREWGFPLVSLETNAGVSAASLAGLHRALEDGYDHAILMDADGQHLASDIKRIELSLETHDAVFCTRVHPGSFMPTQKLAANVLAASLVNELYGSSFTDVSCGMKAIPISEQTIGLLREAAGYQLPFRITLLALEQGQNIGCLPIDSVYDYSQPLLTRRSEIIAFLTAMASCGPYDERVRAMLRDVNNGKSFRCVTNGMEFYGCSIAKTDSYLIQCDPESLCGYVTEMTSGL